MSINLSIKGVPEAWAERLRLRAARQHRSLQGELMALIEAAVNEPEPQVGNAPATMVFRQPGKTIEEIAAAHVSRFPEPIAGGPLAVDIVRGDRDAR